MHGSLKNLKENIQHTFLTKDADFSSVSTDSRNIKPGALFVALRGERFDAHEFLPQIENSGAVAVIVEELPKGFTLPALIVSNTLTALGEIASSWRKQFNIPVIGVTGSNGKTTVKEMISSILAAAFKEEHRLTTLGNLNNEIGVPLTLFRLNETHQAAVVEMGMNHPGEIAKLTKIAVPTIGLVNNAQREHQEFMHTVEAVAYENGSVIQGLNSDGIAVFPGDSQFTPIWKELAENRKVITFGTESKCDVRTKIEDYKFGSPITVESPIGTFQFNLSAAGTHNVLNALAAISCAIAAGISQKKIINGLENFEPVKGRLQHKVAQCGATVIDDTYNANPDSVIAAIDVLAATPHKHILVLGDMGEVGEQGEQFHKEVASYAISKDITEIFVIGDLAKYMVIDKKIKHFEQIEDLLNVIDKSLMSDSKATILVKGSRFMKMERVVNHLIGNSSNKE